jgi:hypothetical protein
VSPGSRRTTSSSAALAAARSPARSDEPLARAQGFGRLGAHRERALDQRGRVLRPTRVLEAVGGLEHAVDREGRAGQHALHERQRLVGLAAVDVGVDEGLEHRPVDLVALERGLERADREVAVALLARQRRGREQRVLARRGLAAEQRLTARLLGLSAPAAQVEPLGPRRERPPARGRRRERGRAGLARAGRDRVDLHREVGQVEQRADVLRVALQRGLERVQAAVDLHLDLAGALGLVGAREQVLRCDIVGRQGQRALGGRARAAVDDVVGVHAEVVEGQQARGLGLAPALALAVVGQARQDLRRLVARRRGRGHEGAR